MTNYLLDKTSQRIEMEGATFTCMFHALYLPAFNNARSRTFSIACVRACVCQNDDKWIFVESWHIDSPVG